MGVISIHNIQGVTFMKISYINPFDNKSWYKAMSKNFFPNKNSWPPPNLNMLSNSNIILIDKNDRSNVYLLIVMSIYNLK